MKPLWTPWRMPYILAIKESARCVFCEEVLAEGKESELILHRGQSTFVVLNLYPYTPGHLMVVPYRHVGNLQDLTMEELDEATALLQKAERTVERELGARRQYVGINIGRCAGAGVEGHIHIHLVPGTEPAVTVNDGEPGEEIPEPLFRTRDRLRQAWHRSGTERPHSSNS